MLHIHHGEKKCWVQYSLPLAPYPNAEAYVPKHFLVKCKRCEERRKKKGQGNDH